MKRQIKIVSDYNGLVFSDMCNHLLEVMNDVPCVIKYLMQRDEEDIPFYVAIFEYCPETLSEGQLREILRL